MTRLAFNPAMPVAQPFDLNQAGFRKSGLRVVAHRKIEKLLSKRRQRNAEFLIGARPICRRAPPDRDVADRLAKRPVEGPFSAA
jgi:hypothetical protein